MTVYITKSLPKAIEKLTQLHKASTKQPLFYLNVFFGAGLLFFCDLFFLDVHAEDNYFQEGSLLHTGRHSSYDLSCCLHSNVIGRIW